MSTIIILFLAFGKNKGKIWEKHIFTLKISVAHNTCTKTALLLRNLVKFFIWFLSALKSFLPKFVSLKDFKFQKNKLILHNIGIMTVEKCWFLLKRNKGLQNFQNMKRKSLWKVLASAPSKIFVFILHFSFGIFFFKWFFVKKFIGKVPSYLLRIFIEKCLNVDDFFNFFVNLNLIKAPYFLLNKFTWGG